MNLCSASNVTRVKFWNYVFKKFFYVVCSRSSALDARSRLKKKKKSGDKGEVNPETSEQKDTEKKKTNDEKPEKMVSNESYGDGEPENIKNSTQTSDNEEEKTDTKDINGDTTLKQDTRKTRAVGNKLEKTVTNESNGDGTSKEDTNKSGNVWNELQKTVTNEINHEGSLQQDAKNKTGTVGKKFEKNCYE